MDSSIQFVLFSFVNNANFRIGNPGKLHRGLEIIFCLLPVVCTDDSIGAVAFLGMHPSTLRARMQKLGIRINRSSN